VEGSCEHCNEPSGSIKCWEVLGWPQIGGFSRRAQLHESVIKEAKTSMYNNQVTNSANNLEYYKIRNKETIGAYN
jgi:hypothetical protein